MTFNTWYKEVFPDWWMRRKAALRCFLGIHFANPRSQIIGHAYYIMHHSEDYLVLWYTCPRCGGLRRVRDWDDTKYLPESPEGMLLLEQCRALANLK